MTRAELYKRSDSYARWRGTTTGHRLIGRGGHQTGLTVLTGLPVWITDVAARGDELSADAELAVIANRAAARLDGDALRLLAADHGEEKLDRLLELPCDDSLSDDGTEILSAALSCADEGHAARTLVRALLAQSQDQAA